MTKGVHQTGQDEAFGCFAGRLPSGWFTGAPQVRIDRDEILVIGTLSEPELPEGSREDTRERRMLIAQEAQHRFGRRVSCGARCGNAERLFTTVSVPAMTRLRMDERIVLDTLVEAGVARSRSHALAWCVRLVASKQDDWLKDLREALTAVERVRDEGPAS